MGAVPEATTSVEGISDPEAEALEALENGAPKRALSVLMQAYGTAVYRFCRQQVADPELAEEAHQMTFVQAYEGLDRFSRRSSLRTWLFSIARHRCLDAAKIASEQHGIEAEVIDLRTVQPFDMQRIADSVKKTNKVVVVHEDSKSWGIGSEIVRLLRADGLDVIPQRGEAGAELLVGEGFRGHGCSPAPRAAAPWPD